MEHREGGMDVKDGRDVKDGKDAKRGRDAKTGFGYGKVKYRTEEDYPKGLFYNGCLWRRTPFQYTFQKSGMANFLYETDDRKEDLRLYVDAAGNIWDEKEKGII